MDRDFTLPPTFVTDQEATLTRRVVLQAVNFAQTNNAEAVLRHVLDRRGLLRHTVSNKLCSSYCHRLHDQICNVVSADDRQQLDGNEMRIKKGLKVY